MWSVPSDDQEGGWPELGRRGNGPPAAEYATTMKRILIVEDVELNRDLLTQLLEEDYELVSAADGAAGVEKAKSEQPDLILMDLSLPVIDGWEATRRIKAAAATAAIPIIALTAHAMAGDREKAMEVGCEEYETKPIEMSRLLGKIAALLRPTAG